MTIIEEEEEIIDNDKVDTQPLNIDDKCDVKWRAGDKTLRAVIIERRSKHFRKRKTTLKKSQNSGPSLESLKADEIEYYVHYIDHDRYGVHISHVYRITNCDD